MAKGKIYTIPIRQADKAYRDTWLWIPKKLINVRAIRYSLTQQLSDGTEIHLWRETEHHIGVPRAKIEEEDIRCELVDLTPKHYDSVSIKSLITLDFVKPELTRQRDAFEDLKDAKGGILNMACGLGKTVVLLHLIAHWKVPAIIITHQVHVLHQWKEEILGTEEDSPKLEFEGELGWIQGKPEKWKWRGCPIILASLTTLAKYIDQVPPELRAHPGVAIWDEVHHVPAPKFSTTADLFYGKRLGASATINRPDGMEILYLWHMGNVLHENLEQDLVPEVVFLKSYTKLDMTDPLTRAACVDVTGEDHYLKINACVACQKEELDLARNLIWDEAVGKNAVVLSTSVNHLKLLHEKFPDSGIIHHKVSDKKRLKILKDHELVFGTVQILREAVDKPSLELLIILTEFSSRNNLQQAIGRVLRDRKGKMPKVIILWHVNIPNMKGMGINLQNHFKRWGMEVQII